MRERRFLPHTKKSTILFLMFVSVVLILWGIFIYADYSNFRKNAEVTIGTVTDVYISSSYKKRRSHTVSVDVTYIVDGKKYNYYIYGYARSRSYTGSKYNGDLVKIMYNKNNPADARRAADPSAKSAIMIISGIVAAVLSYFYSRRNDNYDSLLKNGITLEAVIIDIERSDPVVKNFLVNSIEFMLTRTSSGSDLNDKGYAIICEWQNPVTGQVYRFRSAGVDAFLTPYVGKNVTVYVDPNDYSKYLVDVDSVYDQPAGSTYLSRQFTYPKRKG